MKRVKSGQGQGDECLKRLGELKSEAAGVGAARSAPGLRCPPGGALSARRTREGPAGSQAAAAGTRAGQGHTSLAPYPPTRPRPLPDQGWLGAARVARAGWEPRSPCPRPRDSHALWLLRDSPPRRPRLCQAHRAAAQGACAAALLTTSPGRPRATGPVIGAQNDADVRGAGTSFAPRGLKLLWK